MPRYDFKCEKCGHLFEATKKMSEPNPPCPKVCDHGPHGEHRVYSQCGGQTAVHFASVPQAHFQGGGWAKDLYSSSGSKPLTVNQMLDRSSK
jgi:putative FmdB family regulatory protein